MYRNLLKVAMIGILAATLILVMAAGVAEGERTDASGQWRYVLEEVGATITGYVGEPPEDLVFPGELDGYPVARIGRWASDDVNVASVTIPDSVTHIGANAFAWYCPGLSSVNIPDSVVSIGSSAFYYCGLTAVTIPAGVTDIGRNPFEGCPMTHIGVAADNPVYEQVDGVLFDRQQKMLVAYPHARMENPYMIPEGVLRIGDGAFSNNGNLTAVIIPDSVTHIGDMAFWACAGLTSMTIPNSVTHIGDMAFKECDSLSRITVPDSVVSIGDEAFGWDSGVTLRITRDSYAEHYAEENGIDYALAQPERAETTAELTGAWRTAEDDEGFVTLILYPGDAFRLYRYHKEGDETFMLEGVRLAEGGTIVVSDIRLGILDSDGVYTQTGEKHNTRYAFSLVPGDPAALTLTDEQGDTITLFPADLDGPG